VHGFLGVHGTSVNTVYKAHLLFHWFINFIFFSFNQKFLGPLNESVLGTREISCQMAIHSLATTAWQSSTFVLHPSKQLSKMINTDTFNYDKGITNLNSKLSQQHSQA
jgi:hypothetical protein